MAASTSACSSLRPWLRSISARTVSARRRSASSPSIAVIVRAGAHNRGMDTTGQIARQLPEGTVSIHSLPQVADEAGIDLATFPPIVKILLDHLVGRRGARTVPVEVVAALARW